LDRLTQCRPQFIEVHAAMSVSSQNWGLQTITVLSKGSLVGNGVSAIKLRNAISHGQQVDEHELAQCANLHGHPDTADRMHQSEQHAGREIGQRTARNDAR